MPNAESCPVAKLRGNTAAAVSLPDGRVLSDEGTISHPIPDSARIFEQPAGIQTLIADIIGIQAGNPTSETFRLVACTNQLTDRDDAPHMMSNLALNGFSDASVLDNTNISLVCGPYAFQRLSIRYNVAARDLVADVPLPTRDLKFLAAAHEQNGIPSTIARVVAILVARGFGIMYVDSKSSLARVALRLGDAVNGISVDLTWV